MRKRFEDGVDPSELRPDPREIAGIRAQMEAVRRRHLWVVAGVGAVLNGIVGVWLWLAW